MVTSKLVSACEAVGSEMIHWKFNAITVYIFNSQVIKGCFGPIWTKSFVNRFIIANRF